MKIFLDDQAEAERKNWVPVGWITAKNFAEFKIIVYSTLINNIKIQAISFDNDLGERETEGRYIAKWLLTEHPESLAPDVRLFCHSQNPVAKKAILAYFSWWRNTKEEK